MNEWIKSIVMLLRFAFSVSLVAVFFISYVVLGWAIGEISQYFKLAYHLVGLVVIFNFIRLEFEIIDNDPR